MREQKDIGNIDDIKLLVDSFYDTIKQDDLLAEIFNGIIKDNWPAHLEKMYRFWQTILLNEHTYHGSPFPPHMKMPIGEEHFDQWKIFFTQKVDQRFAGEKAEEAKWRAQKMAQMFQIKINYHQNSHSKTIVYEAPK